MRRLCVVGMVAVLLVACGSRERDGNALDASPLDVATPDVPAPGDAEATDANSRPDADADASRVEVDAIGDAPLGDPGPLDRVEPGSDAPPGEGGPAEVEPSEAQGPEETLLDGGPPEGDTAIELVDDVVLADPGGGDGSDGTSPELLTEDLATPDLGADLGQTGLCAAKTLSPWSRKIQGVGGTATFNELMIEPVAGSGAPWLELANPMAVDLDLSGWRLDGAARYTFPEGTRLPARGTLLVAADPAQLEQASGAEGVLGPFDGQMPAGGGTLELRTNTDRLMDALTYVAAEPWPVVARGSGASLAKRRPDASSELAENWGGSPRVGGTPGQPNASSDAPSPPPSGLWFNEVAGGDGAFWLELANVGPAEVDLGGFVVRSSSGAEVVLAPTLVAVGAIVLLDDADLGLDAAVGDRLFLLAPDGLTVHDGVEVLDVPRARPTPGGGPWRFPDASTPGASNQVIVSEPVVLNEIMYHAGPLDPPGGPPQASTEEWIELVNPGSQPVDVGGWQLVDDIEYTFPKGVVLAPGALLVVARNASALKAAHPGVPILGDFKGKLANSEASLVLRDACGNPVDAVHYYDGGRWPALADGGGSSLELRSPLADNAVPEAWAASDESGAVGWQTFSYQGVAAPSPVGPDGRWHEFVVGLLDDGVVLLDDVSVVEDPDGAALELLQDGTFETGAAAGWRLLGNHRHSSVVPDPAEPGNHVLRLEATGATEHMHNHAETTLAGGRTITNGVTYRVSFRARWVGGSNRLNTRLYFNRLTRTTLLPRPAHGGTPGKPNRALVPDWGPTYRDLAHAPVVPAPDQAVWVTVVPSDPDGVATVALHVSVDGGEFSAQPMLDLGDGRFAAAVPGQPAGTLVQFYVEGTDGLGVTSTFPADGPASRALWKVDDGLAATHGLYNLRILLTPADAAWLHAEPNVMSNDSLGATVIADEGEAFYDVGVRLKGSERGRSMPLRTGFALSFHAEQPFRGVYRSVMVDRSEGVTFGQREMLINQVMSHAGSVSAEYDDLVHVMPPRPEHTGPAELQLARFGDLALDGQFEGGSEGPTYEYELVYYPTTTADGTPEGAKLPQPDLVVGTPIRDLGDDVEAYRLSFLLGNSLWKDDFAPLMAFAKAFGQTGAAFEAQVGDILDLDQWLRAFAFATLSGAIDNYASGAQHNVVFYVRPSDGRVLYFPHDLDFYGASSTTPLVASGDLARLLVLPAARRLYYGHLYDIVQTSYNATYMGPWCAHFGALLPAQNFEAHCQFIASRADWVLNGAPDAVAKAFPPLAFAVTTNEGADFAVPDATVTLEGTGWIDVREVWRLGDVGPLPVAWMTATTWVVELPLACGANALVLQAVGPHGELVGSAAVTVTSQAAGCP